VPYRQPYRMSLNIIWKAVERPVFISVTLTTLP
jgi:hypothetical protein